MSRSVFASIDDLRRPTNEDEPDESDDPNPTSKRAAEARWLLHAKDIKDMVRESVKRVQHAVPHVTVRSRPTTTPSPPAQPHVPLNLPEGEKEEVEGRARETSTSSPSSSAASYSSASTCELGPREEEERSPTAPAPQERLPPGKQRARRVLFSTEGEGHDQGKHEGGLEGGAASGTTTSSCAVDVAGRARLDHPAGARAGPADADADEMWVVQLREAAERRGVDQRRRGVDRRLRRAKLQPRGTMMSRLTLDMEDEDDEETKAIEELNRLCLELGAREETQSVGLS